MKIFISHSSRDKWAARRISTEIEQLGAETFLDEKDIETGEPIDGAISDHLKDCDELLVLLSPASVKSEWVLVEVGGAKALGKRLIPVLFYLGANEIPSPISKHLARDINNIEVYYGELRTRMDESTPPTRSVPSRRVQPPRRQPITYVAGDVVRLPLSQPQDQGERETGPNIGWEKGMERYLGERTEITYVDDDRSARVDVDGGEYWWAFEWLRKDT